MPAPIGETFAAVRAVLDPWLGEPLRQRKKGRDLFDLWYAIEKGAADVEKILACFARYMREAGRDITRADFEHNLAAKLEDHLFLADMTPLLRPGISDTPRHGCGSVTG